MTPDSLQEEGLSQTGKEEFTQESQPHGFWRTNSWRSAPSSSTDLQLDDEIVLQGQVITPRQHKVTQFASLIMLLLSVAAFTFAMIFKYTSAAYLFQHPVVQKCNACFAALNILFLGFMVCKFTYNLALVHSAKLRWTKRKRTLSYMVFAQLLIQFINSVFFLVPNLSSAYIKCSWFDEIEIASGIIRWTCWNSIFCISTILAHNTSPWLDKSGALRRGYVSPSQQNVPLIIMDASFVIHVPKLLIWCAFEFCILFLIGSHPRNADFIVYVVPGQENVPCQKQRRICGEGVEYIVFTALWIIFLLFYVCAITAFIKQTRRRLLLVPYNELVNVHLMVLRQKAQVWYLYFIGVMMVPVLWYSRLNPCNNYLVAWMGMLPLQVIASTVIFINAYHLMPLTPGNNSIQQAWLQEFVWREADFDAKMEKRAAHNPAVREQLMKEPLFCFETAVKLLMWSELVYKRTSLGKEPLGKTPSGSTGDDSSGKKPEVTIPVKAGRDDTAAWELQAAVAGGNGAKVMDAEGSNGDAEADKAETKEAAVKALLDTAMQMYDLEHFEIMHEELLETRILIAWSSTTVLLAFRGTAERINMKSDAKAWRTAHPPNRGRWFMGTQPLVHKGFLETWQVNGLDAKVMEQLRCITAAGKVPAADFRVLLTGHSLGGALATLAAINLQKEFRFKNMSVYTFGAPRTGNHAFARDYEAHCPSTWHVINDSDAVPRSGKFVSLYKRPGQRALVNKFGDLRVRPSVLEVCIHNTGFSIKAHHLRSYLSALFSICAAQCMKQKGLPGGRRGVEALATSPQLQTYFGTADLDLEKLTQTPPEEVTLPSLQQQQKRLKGFRYGLVHFFSEILEDVAPLGTGILVFTGLQRPESEAEAESEDEETISDRFRVVRERWIEAARLAQGGEAVGAAARLAKEGDAVAAASLEAEAKPVEAL